MLGTCEKGAVYEMELDVGGTCIICVIVHARTGGRVGWNEARAAYLRLVIPLLTLAHCVVRGGFARLLCLIGLLLEARLVLLPRLMCVVSLLR